MLLILLAAVALMYVEAQNAAQVLDPDKILLIGIPASILIALILFWFSQSERKAVAAARSTMELLKRKDAENRNKAEIIEAASDFVAIADAAGKVLYMNKAGKQMAGLDPDMDVRGTAIPMYHPQWATEHIIKVMLPLAIRDGIAKAEVALLHKNGTEIPLSMFIISHKDEAGNVKFLSTISRDITEEKKIRAELKKKIDEAEELNKVMLGRELQIMELKKKLATAEAEAKTASQG
jgi:PAS domain S-box-containing protein